MGENLLVHSLPDEITISCLARLPRCSRAIASCVSKAWQNALKHISLINSIRVSLNLTPEHWIFMGLFDTECDPGFVQATKDNTQWLLLDPLTLRTLVLGNPLAGLSAVGISVGSAAANGKIFMPEIPVVINHQKIGFCSYNIDAAEEGWKPVAFPPQQTRRFACAQMNDFIFVSGGVVDVTGEASRGAFRYNTRTDEWETLPDMIMPRINCTGLAMNGNFFAIGGYHCSAGFMQSHASGEFFDSESWEWKLVPDLCAKGLRHAEHSSVAEPAFAFVEKKIYAMQSQSNEVMEFDPLTERWTNFGFNGGDSENKSYSVDYKLLGVGSELWGIEYSMGKSVCIYRCEPGKETRESRYVKWMRIQVPGIERFDHVLTCTAFTV